MFCKKVNFDLKYHFVLCTGYRHPILKNNIKVRCQEIITNLMENNFDCNIIEMNIQPNHIHIMFETTPSIQLSKMVCSIVKQKKRDNTFVPSLFTYFFTSYPSTVSGSVLSVSSNSFFNVASLFHFEFSLIVSIVSSEIYLL